MSRDTTMPQARYIAALYRFRDAILRGRKKKGFDDDTTGCKDTQFSWGLCDGTKEMWPEPKDHLWPDQFLKSGRVAPLYLRVNQQCPLDRRTPDNVDSNGCFYTCRFFSPNKGDEPLTTQFVVKLYDQRIAEHTPKDQPNA